MRPMLFSKREKHYVMYKHSTGLSKMIGLISNGYNSASVNHVLILQTSKDKVSKFRLSSHAGGVIAFRLSGVSPADP